MGSTRARAFERHVWLRTGKRTSVQMQDLLSVICLPNRESLSVYHSSSVVQGPVVLNKSELLPRFRGRLEWARCSKDTRRWVIGKTLDCLLLSGPGSAKPLKSLMVLAHSLVQESWKARLTHSEAEYFCLWPGHLWPESAAADLRPAGGVPQHPQHRPWRSDGTVGSCLFYTDHSRLGEAAFLTLS